MFASHIAIVNTRTTNDLFDSLGTNMHRIIVLFTLIACLFEHNGCLGNRIYHSPLDESNANTVDWMLDYNTGTVTFEVHVQSFKGWFAIGFSNRGEQFPADYCILWRDINKHTYFQDTWADDSGVVYIDGQQDCDDFKIKQKDDITKFTFKRKFDTCDSKDYIILEGTTHIVWSRGNDVLYKVNGLNISSPEKDHGMVHVQLLKNTRVSHDVPQHTRPVDFLTDKVKVPAKETTYWCHTFKLSEEFKTKHHVYKRKWLCLAIESRHHSEERKKINPYKFVPDLKWHTLHDWGGLHFYVTHLGSIYENVYEANIQKESQGLVHHMELFHCEVSEENSAKFPLYAGDCYSENRPEATQVCKRVLAAWAMGAEPMVYPNEAGLPIGGERFSPYVMLEVHYNNPKRKADFIDSSGIRLHVSDKLKEMDAGVIELGLEYTDKMAIPPGQESFPLVGYCVSECTAVGLPAEGITVFASQLHTHLTGIRVMTRHIRNGIEQNKLNSDDHYTTHFQEIRTLKKPVHVLPGDALITRCDYNTEGRINVTLGGFAISDEMCVNYIHYYPATPLEVCKSAISNQALDTYFRYMHEWEGQATVGNKGISDKYKAIEWNKMRVQLLREVYSEAPLSMQCNMSSGDRFPGYWENTPVTSLLRPLPPPQRKCEDISDNLLRM